MVLLAALERRPSVIRLHSADNVGIAVRALGKGSVLLGGLSAKGDIPAGHKVCLEPIEQGKPVVKYGQCIGFASAAVQPGEHVHTHNCEVGGLSLKHEVGAEYRATDYVTGAARATFQGFLRSDGRVATRNYVAVVTSVNCSATAASAIVERFRERGLQGYPNVDGVVALSHAQGCGMAGSGEGYDLLQRTLGGFAKHVNFGGVLLLGLGCEVNQPRDIHHHQNLGPQVSLLGIQESGGTRAAVENGVKLIADLLPKVDAVRRQAVSVEHLTLGLQCGGSDGYSGITANPALGAAVDLLVRHGGTAILSETPEIYGAEHLLVRRAQSPDVAQKLLARIAWWERYTKLHGAEMNNNPSPGNKAGGLTTILEKSLGAVAKSGTAPLMGVYEYAEPIVDKGLVFMDSPGYDPCSATGQVASGANIICFTTGRGSVFGCKPTPSLKLATNTPLYERMLEDMDINCGDIVEGKSTVAQKGEEIFALLLEVASGKKTKSELLGVGDHEFVPWHIGAVM